MDFGPNWEFNFGVGVGLTQATDHLLIKGILGYRFHNKKRNPPGKENQADKGSQN